MNDYLHGFLSVIPESERLKIQDVIRNNQVRSPESINEKEFQLLLDRITKEHIRASQYIAQSEKLDSKAYNEFFTGVQMDLITLFKESDYIHTAIQNYDRLFEGVLSDIQKEIKGLKERIQTLKLKNESDTGTMLKTFLLGTDGERETDRQTKSYLFQDRDGTMIPNVVIERTAEKNRMLLNRSMSNNTQDAQGKAKATMKVVDRRGMPVERNNPMYNINNAIDGSIETYWGEVILVDEPINIPFEEVQGETTRLFPAGGSYAKLELTFNQHEIMSEIILTPFSKYPMEIMSLAYEEDIDTYFPKVELLQVNTTYESTGAMIISFPSVMVKRLTIIVRQKNYEQNTYLIRTSQLRQQALWEQLSQREAEVTLDLSDGIERTEQSEIDRWTGWDIYIKALQDYREQLQKYKQRLVAYKEEYDKYQADTEAYNRIVDNYQTELNYYNSVMGRSAQNEYQRITNTSKNYKQYESDYEQRMTSYEQSLRTQFMPTTEEDLPWITEQAKYYETKRREGN